MGIIHTCLNIYKNKEDKDKAKEIVKKACKKAIIFLFVNMSIMMLLYFFMVNQSSSDVQEDFTTIKIGGNSYQVDEDFENPQIAAETMDKLNQIAKKLISFVDNKYNNNVGDGYYKLKEEYRKHVTDGINRLKKNFITANMQENIPSKSGGDTSYVLNKGDVFAMCIRDPNDKNEIQDNFNELVFVLVHELSHIFTKGYGHDDEFWTNFRFLLNEATEMKEYKKTNYAAITMPYCGISITYSPLFDIKLKDYTI